MRYINTSGQPVFDGGRFTGYRGIARDVTASMRAEQLLRLEHMVARCLAGADSASAALQAVIRAVCETQGWQCGRYFRVDNKAGVLRFAEFWSVPDAMVERFIDGSRDVVFAQGVGLTGWVWQSGQPLWVADLSKDPRVHSKGLHRDASSRGAFVFPVMVEGKTVGVLGFNSREVREPDDRLLQAVRVIGSQIGQFLQRKQVEEDLRRFRVAMDMSADLILLVDRASIRYIDVNDAACRALGYSREELLTMGPPDIFSKSREELAQLYDQMFASEQGAPIVTGVYRRKDGSQFPVEAFPRAVRSASGDVIVSIARDVSERLAAEEALRKSNERFNVAVRATNDIIWDWDLSKNEIWRNENFV
jgi:PAS domain S-box-containing protein